MSVAHTGGRSFTADSGTTSLLSPHLSGSVAEQLIPQATPSGRNRASSFRLQTSLQDLVHPGESESLQQAVISLQDYRASRSDELTTRRGDVIHVLHKDTDDWWFGRLADGQQGYFLASNVTDRTHFNEEVSGTVERNAASSEGTGERATPTRVSAAISSSGELRFLSEPTFSDSEPDLTDSKARRKKKVKKPEPTGTRRRGRSTDRPLPKRPSGRTNGAFQPEA